MATNRTSEVPVLEKRIAELEEEVKLDERLYEGLRAHTQDLERQNTDLQARNTELVEKNRRLMLVTQGKLDEALS